ncbi:MAG: GTP-binding protein [Patescibacteria group bacterium]|nr:GTP-binding protein [Patescibacteria group bacterium]
MTQQKSTTENAQTGLRKRPPIVVVMGHVDHGKTTLLDFIRKSNVAEREAGGITQATAAYEILHPSTSSGQVADRKITFIDTPGHEAFTAMRSRGATAADIAILVVAADEGVKPQTKEAIAILQESKTPFVVAFTKIDKPGANLEKAKTDLMASGVLLEGYGGQVSYHGVSAKTGEGVGDLLDLILLATDMENLTYDPAAAAAGFVLEARRDPRRGIAAAVVVKNGVLKRGDPIATPSASGKIKILENFMGKPVEQLEPSAPAVVIGFEELPNVGEEFGENAKIQMANAKRISSPRAAMANGQKKGALNLILKSSDAGSLEALSVVLRNLQPQGGKTPHIVDESVGDITDGDVKHALATDATIIGFKNRIEKGARNLAEAHAVTMITSDIVYDLAAAVEEFLIGVRGPSAQGELEILAVFNSEKLDKQLVGGRVADGTIRNRASFEIKRGGEGAEPAVVGTGRIVSLQEKKNEIAQAEQGKEIGLMVNAGVLVQIGDRLVVKK